MGTDAKHTPEPWTALPQNGAGPMIVHEFETGNQMNPTGYRLIAHMLQRKDSLETDRANARLIAAAPDMLAALQRIADAEQAISDEISSDSIFGGQSTEDRRANSRIYAQRIAENTAEFGAAISAARDAIAKASAA